MKRLHGLVLILLAGLLPAVSRADVILQFDPADSVLRANRGTTVGWGLIFENDTPDYAIWAGTALVPSPASTVGTFLDFSTINFLITGPGLTSASQPFDALLPTGAGSFAVSSTAPYGAYVGQMSFVCDLYDGDPTSGGPANYLREFTVSQSFELDVVPEPATFWLVSLVALPALLRRRRSWIV